MKSILFLLFFALAAPLSAQQLSTDTIKAPAATDNIYARPLFGDSLVTSFVIVVKKEVKKHKHASHSEHVYVLEGTGEMLLGDKTIKVKKGDVIFIPKDTPHAVKVTSKKPMKVISVQAPQFDGKDRIMLD